jgi:hypothetical protein
MMLLELGRDGSFEMTGLFYFLASFKMTTCFSYPAISEKRLAKSFSLWGDLSVANDAFGIGA